jgi:hypothetical protein
MYENNREETPVISFKILSRKSHGRTEISHKIVRVAIPEAEIQTLHLLHISATKVEMCPPISVLYICFCFFKMCSICNAVYLRYKSIPKLITPHYCQK